MELRPGSVVRLRAFGDSEIERRVVKLSGEVVIVCRNDEYATALQEGRDPVCVGFPQSAVVENTRP